MKQEIYSFKTDWTFEKEYRILIGADFVPTESNKNLFDEGNIKELFGSELLDVFNSSDLIILNLEAPITNAETKLLKAGGPNLKTYPEIINILSRLPSLILSGANNHIYDYCQNGIEDTLKELDRKLIRHVGFGINIDDAKQACYISFENRRIGVYSCSENEFCCANEFRGGGNGYDPLCTFDEINRAKESCDYLVVLFHGGRENYRYPSVQLKILCQKMVDSGADIVICQHSHCIGTYEIYKKSVIMYGQGNVLFDYNECDEWKTAVLIEIVFSNSRIHYNLIPIEKDDEKVKIAELNAREIINQLENRNKNIDDKEFLNAEYCEFAKTQINALLLRGILGINNRFILGINKITKGKFLRFLFNTEHRLLLSNYIRCESIREAILLLLERE